MRALHIWFISYFRICWQVIAAKTVNCSSLIALRDLLWILWKCGNKCLSLTLYLSLSLSLSLLHFLALPVFLLFYLLLFLSIIFYSCLVYFFIFAQSFSPQFFSLSHSLRVFYIYPHLSFKLALYSPCFLLIFNFFFSISSSVTLLINLYSFLILPNPFFVYHHSFLFFILYNLFLSFLSSLNSLTPFISFFAYFYCNSFHLSFCIILSWINTFLSINHLLFEKILTMQIYNHYSSAENLKKNF